ncbi:MAG: hypothetical protein HOV80_18690, partial [Polyangiaceae bacterium]|nr:hypothetical protein [Polyangiaceae bacterium]
PPVKGKAPPPASPPAQAKTAETTKPFDASKLGQRDATSDKEVARVNERCVSDPFSREGPSPAENAKCTAAVARLVARGKKAAPSILAALNEKNEDRSYYASNRLLFALGKVDDKKVRQAVADGFVAIAKAEMDDQTDIIYQIPDALEAMMGAAPEVDAPWKASSVTDSWEEHRQTAARWKAFVAANEGKSRKQISQDRFAQARKDKADADAEKAYRAISFLVSRSPNEALKAAKAYQKRDDLDDDVASEFESLQSQAEMHIEEQQARAARAKAKS